MTKTLTLILTTFLFLTSFGQTTSTISKFKHTFFDFDGQISDVKENSIQVETTLDLEFYRKNFYKLNLDTNDYLEF